MRVFPVALSLGLLTPPMAAQRLDTGVLPNQKRVEVRLERSTGALPAAEVQAAITGAVRAWNAALPATLQLVEVPVGAPYPPGEAVILIRFDPDPSHFGGSGVEELADVRRTSNRPRNSVGLGIIVVDKPGTFSTNGAPGTRDLQLTLMHELGHALGVEHEDNASGVPPIMAPVLADNRSLLSGGKTLAGLRQITAADRELLKIALTRRASRDVEGSYTGTLSGGPRPQVFNAGDFIIKYEAGKVLLDYKGSKREVPAVDLLNVNFELRFLDVADGRALRTLTLKRGNTPEEIEVEAVLEPGATRYTFTGTLTRPKKP